MRANLFCLTVFTILVALATVSCGLTEDEARERYAGLEPIVSEAVEVLLACSEAIEDNRTLCREVLNVHPAIASARAGIVETPRSLTDEEFQVLLSNSESPEVQDLLMSRYQANDSGTSWNLLGDELGILDHVELVSIVRVARGDLEISDETNYLGALVPASYNTLACAVRGYQNGPGFDNQNMPSVAENTFLVVGRAEYGPRSNDFERVQMTTIHQYQEIDGQLTYFAVSIVDD